MLETDSAKITKAERTISVGIWLLFVAFVLVPAVLAAHPLWKTFFNRAGWSMNYPADWTIGSCRSCTDPTAPEVYVDFFPPKKLGFGFVMVEPLANQPPTMTVDEWFNHIKITNNQNPQLAERRFTINGLPALRVRYRNPSNGGYEMEAVYIVSRGRTLAVTFDAERSGVTLEALENYATYLEMVKTFKMKR